jgi:hypothetical protein
VAYPFLRRQIPPVRKTIQRSPLGRPKVDSHCLPGMGRPTAADNARRRILVVPRHQHHRGWSLRWRNQRGCLWCGNIVTGTLNDPANPGDQSHTNVLSPGPRHRYEAGQHPALQSSARTKPQGSARDRARSCVRLTRLVKWRESQSQVQPLLQEHVIVSLVCDCYSHAVAWS